MKFRIRYADRIAGLFVLLAVLVLCASVFVIGANQRWFAKDYHFSTRLESATGISAGMALTMKGFQVGKVSRLTLTEDNLVDVDFVVYDTYYPKAREGSLVELVTSPIGLGTQFLFYPGKGTALLPEGSFLPTAASEEGSRLVDEGLAEIPVKDDTVTTILASVGPLIDNVNKAVVTLNKTLTEANLAFSGKGTGALAKVVTGAASAVDRADSVIGSVGSKAGVVLDKASELEDSLKSISANLESLTAAMRDPTGLVTRLLDPKGSVKTVLDDQNALYNAIMASISSAQASIKNIQSMTAALNAQVPTIAATIAETQTAVRKAQDVLESLRNNPLLKGGVPQEKQQSELYQSMRDAEF
jgi:phospholipid/cholesterol/gamma-HCH transport system substrate-binding protein